VQEWVEAGHDVTSVDLVRDRSLPCRTLCVDVTDAGQAYQALLSSQAESVVHLAAWANAGIVPDTRTYGDNVRGTFNVFQACADLGVERVISASSAQVYGFAKAPPVYVPVDESHPLRPANCYALSKMAGEQAAKYFAVQRGLTILSFRFMGVRAPRELDQEIERMMRDPASGSRLLWTRTDARDAAMACRLAIEARNVATGPYNVTGSCVVLSERTVELVRRYFGERTEVKGDLPNNVSPMSCSRAEDAFGYRPRYTWSVSQSHPEAT